VDLFMPGGGIRVVREVSRRLPEASVVVLTASEDRDHMVDAVTVRRHSAEVVRKLGARDRGEAVALVQEHS
jgi:DNA-binding NarL/FixJ family response regulator